ncbi:hypothetical protein B6U81_00920 [Thermoplasmatales archaeon ex4484_30]|nr:MAG: hypothetical protein B6U81_00920 [Thermoplasmatales archaeon ex4484_30]
MLPEDLQVEKSIDAVNPRTMEYLSFYSNKNGLMTFPIGVEKRSYLLWDSTLNEIEGMSDRYAPLYYTGNTTYWVEPSTGYIANSEKKGKIKAQFPDLHVLPENTDATLEMEGEMWVLSQGKKDIKMTRRRQTMEIWKEKDFLHFLLEWKRGVILCGILRYMHLLQFNL